VTVSTNDTRAKFVLDYLIDNFSVTDSPEQLFTPMGSNMPKWGESIDIPSRATPITIQQVSTLPGTTSTLTLQSQAPSANNFIIDMHYGGAVEVPKLRKMRDMNGNWAQELARTIRIELGNYIGQDHWDVATTAAYDTAGTYWVNAAGAAITVAMVELTIAKMTSQKGVSRSGLAWMFNPYGIGAIRSLPSWQSNEATMDGKIGLPVVGALSGIPVYVSQSVRPYLTATTSAAVITGTGTVLTLTVPAGHNFVPGMKATTTGLTSGYNVSSKTVASVTATTIVLTTTGLADGTAGDGVGTITAETPVNGLIYRPWAYSNVQQVPDIEIVKMSGGGAGSTTKIGDEMQFDAIWGRAVLAGAVYMLGSPYLAVS